ESRPPRKTDSPRRVTSRSSWMSTKRCATRREIFRRTEFDPMSTAAKVGIQQQFSPCGKRLRHYLPDQNEEIQATAAFVGIISDDGRFAIEASGAGCSPIGVSLRVC